MVNYENEAEALPKNSEGKVVLDIGCGVRPNPEASITMDDAPGANPTIVADIGEKWPLPSCSVDKIYARAVLEHLTHDTNRVVFDEVQRVLKPGGEFWFRVPHYFSLDAAHDPTHKSFWTLHTVEFFCGKRLSHVFDKKTLSIKDATVFARFPTPLSFFAWPRFRFSVRGGVMLEQLIKLPFVLGGIDVLLEKSNDSTE